MDFHWLVFSFSDESSTCDAFGLVSLFLYGAGPRHVQWMVGHIKYRCPAVLIVIHYLEYAKGPGCQKFMGRRKVLNIIENRVDDPFFRNFINESEKVSEWRGNYLSGCLRFKFAAYAA